MSVMTNNNGRFVALISVIMIIGLLVTPVVSSGYFWAFIDLPTLLFVIGAPFGLLLFSYDKEFLVFVWHSFLAFCGSKVPENKRFAGITKMGQRYVLAASLVCCVKNCVVMLQDLSDPFKIGVGMAVAMLPFTYALVAMYLIFLPLEVTYKVEEAAGSYEPPPVTALLLRTLQLFAIVLALFILLNVLAE